MSNPPQYTTIEELAEDWAQDAIQQWGLSGDSDVQNYLGNLETNVTKGMLCQFVAGNPSLFLDGGTSAIEAARDYVEGAMTDALETAQREAGSFGDLSYNLRRFAIQKLGLSPEEWARYADRADNIYADSGWMNDQENTLREVMENDQSEWINTLMGAIRNSRIAPKPFPGNHYAKLIENEIRSFAAGTGLPISKVRFSRVTAWYIFAYGDDPLLWK